MTHEEKVHDLYMFKAMVTGILKSELGTCYTKHSDEKARELVLLMSTTFGYDEKDLHLKHTHKGWVVS